jgi:hypothetical protein
MEVKIFLASPKETKQHTQGTEPQGLPNLTKKNYEKIERQLKQEQ